MGDNMFRLKRTAGADMCLGMTHEGHLHRPQRTALLPAAPPDLVRRSRRNPRQAAAQVERLLRVREFTMKDSYSFDVDWDSLDKSYRLHYDAYCRIYARCGLDYFAVEAHSGSIGGSQSHEFMVRSVLGEDLVVRCPGCGYAANLEKAASRIAPVTDTDPAGPEPVRVATPGQKTIEEITQFLGVPAQNQIKTLVYVVDSKPTLILMRGDHQLNEAKLEALTGTALLRPATADEIVAAMGADAGSLGPVGVKNLPILADEALRGRRNMTTGANATDFHIQGVTPDVHFTAAYHDLRTVADGDLCPACDTALGVFKSIEVGHIFKLGTKYSDALGASVLNRDGQSVPIVMGSYGIGEERILSAAVEQCHDDKGIIFHHHRPLRRDHRPREHGGQPAGRDRRPVLRGAPRGRPRGALRRPARAAGRQVQRRRPGGHPRPDHPRDEEARPGAGRGDGAPRGRGRRLPRGRSDGPRDRRAGGAARARSRPASATSVRCSEPGVAMNQSLSMEITFSNGKKLSIRKGSTLLDILRRSRLKTAMPVVAAKINNRLTNPPPQAARRLAGGVHRLCHLRFRVYQSSLVYLLGLVVERLFPRAEMNVEHSLSKGLYCELSKESPLTKDELRRIEGRNARAHRAGPAAGQGRPTSTRPASSSAPPARRTRSALFRHSNPHTIDIYICNGYQNYSDCPLVPSTVC